MKAIFAVPAWIAIVYRAWSHNSLTPAGLVVAALTAAIHALHPRSLPFVLLGVFFLAGTRVTKVKKDVKEKLTIQSTGSSGEGPRTHVQVLANSGVASALVLLTLYQRSQQTGNSNISDCYPWGSDLLMIGIIANYAAVAADTFSSELGILSESQPRLITSLNLRKVPKGTNGGVTIWGLAAGLLGSLVIVVTSLIFLPFCGSPLYHALGFKIGTAGEGLSSDKIWSMKQILYLGVAMTIWGGLGSVLDSLLGGWLQQSVVDTRSGRVVEGEGGKKVLISKHGPNSMHFKKRAEVKAQMYGSEGKDAIPKPADSSDLSGDQKIEGVLDEKMGWINRYDPKKKMRQPSFGSGEPSRTIESGLGILDNNEVNFFMALTMSLGAMTVAGWIWDIPFNSLLHT